MYIWNTKRLASDIKNNNIGEKAKLFYYLIFGVFTSLAFPSVLPEYWMPDYDPTQVITLQDYLINLLLVVLIFIIGTLVTFRSNKGKGGSDYIARVVMLSVPISIKFNVLLLLILAILLPSVMNDPLSIQSANSLEIVANIKDIKPLMYVVMFWRINFHLKYIND